MNPHRLLFDTTPWDYSISTLAITVHPDYEVCYGLSRWEKYILAKNRISRYGGSRNWVWEDVEKKLLVNLKGERYGIYDCLTIQCIWIGHL